MSCYNPECDTCRHCDPSGRNALLRSLEHPTPTADREVERLIACNERLDAENPDERRLLELNVSRLREIQAAALRALARTSGPQLRVVTTTSGGPTEGGSDD